MSLAQSHFWIIALKNTLDLLKKKKICLFYTSLIKKQLHTNCNCIETTLFLHSSPIL